MRFPLIFLTLIFAFLSPSFAASPELKSAIAHYLDGEDERALPILSSLAREGDTDAQVLLGRIAQRPHSIYVIGQPRKQRNALLRAPGGLSGKSWLTVAAEAGDARARAYEAAKNPSWSSQTAIRLLEIGDQDAAIETVRSAIPYGLADDARAVLTTPLADPETEYLTLIWLDLFNGLGESDRPRVEAYLKRRDAGAARFLEVYGLPRGWSPYNIFPGVLAALRGDVFSAVTHGSEGVLELYRAHPTRATRRVIAFCNRACPTNMIRCAADATALAGGYDRLWSLGSPAPQIIPEGDYLTSRRFAYDYAAHLIAVNAARGAGFIEPLKKTSCAARFAFAD